MSSIKIFNKLKLLGVLARLQISLFRKVKRPPTFLEKKNLILKKTKNKKKPKNLILIQKIKISKSL